MQILAYNFCKLRLGKEKFLLSLDTGQGKTALCLAVGCLAAEQGFSVYIVNGSSDLTFRDYKKAEDCNLKFNFPVNFI